MCIYKFKVKNLLPTKLVRVGGTTILELLQQQKARNRKTCYLNGAASCGLGYRNNVGS